MADRAVNLETVIGMVNTYFRNVLNLNPDLLIDGIVSLPTVDAVPVRCKNCRYNSNPPERGNAACVLFYGMTDQMGFCHHGERREQDETD